MSIENCKVVGSQSWVYCWKSVTSQGRWLEDLRFEVRINSKLCKSKCWSCMVWSSKWQFFMRHFQWIQWEMLQNSQHFFTSVTFKWSFLAGKARFGREKTLKPWCFSQLCSMTWLGYLPRHPFAWGCEAVHFTSCGLGVVERGGGGLLGKKRTYPSSAVVNPKKILLMEEIPKQPPGMYKTCGKWWDKHG